MKKYYRDCKFITQAKVGEKVTVLVEDEDTGRFYAYWGLGEYKTRVEILTPSGRKVSQTTAMKKFLEMVEAAKYLTFSSF